MKRIIIIFSMIYAVMIIFIAIAGYEWHRYKKDGLLFQVNLIDEESLVHYYRNPQPETIVPAVKRWIDSVWWLDKTEDYEMSIHFFAAILQQNQDKIEKLQALQNNYAWKRLATLKRIIDEAKDYKSAKPDSPSSLKLLWAEFYATGETDIIKKILQIFDLPENVENQALIDAAKQQLIKRAPQHARIYTFLQDVINSSEMHVSNRINEIMDYLKDNAEKPAEDFLYRGHNYYTQGDYSKALVEFKKALEYFPDYPNVLINMANAYEGLGKPEKELSCLQKAIRIDPSNTSACYNLGRLYFLKGKYDEAILSYQEALKRKPKHPGYLHAIARAYQEKGDTANAVKYFQQYLIIAPHDGTVGLVKNYLASVNASLPEREPDLLTLLEKKDYSSLEQRLRSILHEKKKNENGDSCLSLAYNELCYNLNQPHNLPTKLLNKLEAWLQYDPQSHFANACIGIFYVDYAWQARGDSWANTVTDEGWRLFNDRIQKASGYLNKAYALDPTDSIVPAYLIRVAMALGSEYKEMEIQFQRALQADKSEYSAYIAKMNYLKPQWHGSKEEMFAFARETVKNAPQDSLAPRILVNAHWEMYYRSKEDRSYFRQPETWNEIKSIYQMLEQRFPKSNRNHNWFALTAYLAGDDNTAAEEIKQIQDDCWLEDVWGDYEYFKSVKEKLLSKH